MSIFRPRDKNDPRKGFISRSFSGNERNRLFMQADDNFEDVSLVSGADFREDGRGFALLDFDQDGWLDLGIMSTQRPRFRLLRNTIGDGQANPNHFAYVRLIGGHHGTEPTSEWSPRDPCGTTVLVTIGETKRMHHYSCGEGFSTQNSKWIHIGMKDAEKIDRLEINWPSGKKTVHENVPAGSRLTLLENEASK